MKYLHEYTADAVTNLLNRTGAFFAFSNKQFNEKAQKDINYVNMSAGLVCPKDNAKELDNGLSDLGTLGIELDLAENSKKDIIWRELANYETQISRDPQDAVDVLKKYNISEEEVKKEYSAYMDHCIEHDLF